MVKRKSYKNQSLFRLALIIVIAVLVNILSSTIYHRFDLTEENRYSLTNATIEMLKDLDDQVLVKVYLSGELPPGFQRLRNATKEMLNEMRAYSGDKLTYKFIDPTAMEGKKERDQFYSQLVEKGLQPTNLKVRGNEEYSEQILFPGALLVYKGGKKEFPVELLKNQPGLGPQQSINNSIAGLEFAFASTIRKLQLEQKPKIGFIRGHGELPKPQLADIINHLSQYYDINWIHTGDVLRIPQQFKVIVIAKPMQKFTEQDKFKIDQYIMHGGKVLWLVERVRATLDSLRSSQKAFLAQGIRLNLQDQLFKYGVRINEDLVQDMQCSPIPIVVGYSGGQPQQQLKPWYFYPLLMPTSSHPIVKNLDAVLTRFANSIDTVGGANIKKTVLLRSSKHSRVVNAPTRVNLSMLRYEPPQGMFDKPFQPMAVLLEGEFPSLFKNRLAPKTLKILDSLEIKFKAKSPSNKMIVISDGDIIRNDVNRQGDPLPLGYYQYTNYTFANKDFISNAIEYLCDNAGIIEARKKEIKLRLLNDSRVKKEQLTWQFINMIGPLLFIGVFGFIFNFVRIRKYGYE